MVRAALLTAHGSAHFPCYVTEMTTDLGTKVVVYVEHEPVDDFSPGDKAIRVTVLAPETLAATLPMFRIGNHRTTLEKISVVRSNGPDDAGDILVTHTSHEILSATSKHFYAFCSLEWPFYLSLVRVEGNTGRPFFFDYSPHNGHWVTELGPMVVGATSAQEWVDRLDTGSPAQVLSVLFFLCGEHADQDEKEYPGVAKQIPQALSLLKKDEGAVLRKLSTHENAWIREYVRVLNQKITKTANQ